MTNRKITIRFTADKNGKPRAHYWGQARRWLPIAVAKAEVALATGQIYGCQAVRNATTSDPLPVGYVHTSREGDVFSV